MRLDLEGRRLTNGAVLARAAAGVQSRMPIPNDASSTIWLRALCRAFVGPQTDVDLAGRQPVDDEDAADLAGRPARRRPIRRRSATLDGERPLPGRLRRRRPAGC